MKTSPTTINWPAPYVAYQDFKEMRNRRDYAAKIGAWKEFHRLDEILDKALVIPEFGIPGTVHYYTDSCSGYVQKMLTPKKLVFKETGIYSSTIVFSLRKNGLWVKVGQQVRDGVRLTLGWAHDYRCEEI